MDEKKTENGIVAGLGVIFQDIVYDEKLKRFRSKATGRMIKTPFGALLRKGDIRL